MGGVKEIREVEAQALSLTKVEQLTTSEARLRHLHSSFVLLIGRTFKHQCPTQPPPSTIGQLHCNLVRVVSELLFSWD